MSNSYRSSVSVCLQNKKKKLKLIMLKPKITERDKTCR